MAILTLSCFLGVVFVSNPLGNKQNQCDVLISIASDPVKLEYIEKWKERIFRNIELLKKIGYSGRVFPDEQPVLFNKLGYDWEFFGIDPEFASISFNQGLADRNNTANLENVKSLSIGLGRNSIIYQLGKYDETGILGFNNISKDIVKVSDKIFVYCP